LPYAVTPDPYCYPGSTVLKNVPGFRDQAPLDEFEARVYKARAEQVLPDGRLTFGHYKAVHKHLFQDVYAWAGKFRTVRIAKGDSMFCYPEHIDGQMKALFGELKRKRLLFGLDADTFAAEMGAFLATLNAIHPFREGNGRTQLAFASLMAARAEHPLQLDRLEPDKFLKAMIVSFSGNDKPLAQIVRKLIA